MIRILCTGKLKEAYFAAACAEYVKRLSRYTQLEIVECADEKAPEELSDAMRAQVKNAESARVLAHLGDADYAVALTPGGKKLSSEAFAAMLDGLMTSGRSRVAFMIGGSLGLSDEALARADMKLSFSDMTFPHQLFRIMLLEQIYRAFRIIRGEPYHK